MDPFPYKPACASSLKGCSCNEVQIGEVVSVLKEDECLLERKEELASSLGLPKDAIADIMKVRGNNSEVLKWIFNKWVSTFGKKATIGELCRVLDTGEFVYLAERLVDLFRFESRLVLSFNCPCVKTASFRMETNTNMNSSTESSTDMEIDQLAGLFHQSVIDENGHASTIFLENIPETSQQLQVVQHVLKIAGVGSNGNDCEIPAQVIGLERLTNVFGTIKYHIKGSPRSLQVKIRSLKRLQGQSFTSRIADNINNSPLTQMAGIKAKCKSIF